MAKEVVTVRVEKLRQWAERAKSAQIALDLDNGAEAVAIRAGQLQDLSEDILRELVAAEGR